MERFINSENLKRYRKLASEATTEAERSKLLALLAEEKVKFVELQKNPKSDLKAAGQERGAERRASDAAPDMNPGTEATA
ncbi:MAG: hypothetical protein ABSC72_10965 [Methylovirgula sp.]